MSTISVALTTYNGERFLQQQLDSLAAQTRRPDELVVCDDGSSDRTWAILTEFAKTAPITVRLHENKARLGWRLNFIQASSLCSSELVAFCDQDDIWHPDKLAEAAAALEEPEALLFTHAYWLIDDAGERIKGVQSCPTPGELRSTIRYLCWPPPGFSMVFKRSLLQFSDLWRRAMEGAKEDNANSHDSWTIFLARTFGKVVTSASTLVEYRRHSGNTSPPWPTALLPSLLRRGRDRLANPAAVYRGMARVAADRASILAAIEERTGGAWRDRAAAGKAHYRELASRLQERAGLYECRSMARRLRQVLRLWREGGYRDAASFGFNHFLFLKDLALGVLLKPLLREGTPDGG